MATKKPVGTAPVRVNPNDANQGWNLNWNWQIFIEQLRQNSVDIRDFTLTIDPSSVSANTTEEQSFTTEEVDSSDLILSVNKPSHDAGLGIAGFRAGSGKLFITFINTTGSPVDPSQEDYLVALLKRN